MGMMGGPAMVRGGPPTWAQPGGFGTASTGFNTAPGFAGSSLNYNI
jgi:hypothetical protein